MARCVSRVNTGRNVLAIMHCKTKCFCTVFKITQCWLSIARVNCLNSIACCTIFMKCTWVQLKCFNVLASKLQQATRKRETINLSYPIGCSQRVMGATFPRYARRQLVNNALWRCWKSATFANTRNMRFPAATGTILSATVARIIRSIFHWN